MQSIVNSIILQYLDCSKSHHYRQYGSPTKDPHLLQIFLHLSPTAGVHSQTFMVIHKIFSWSFSQTAMLGHTIEIIAQIYSSVMRIYVVVNAHSSPFGSIDFIHRLTCCSRLNTRLPQKVRILTLAQMYCSRVYIQNTSPTRCFFCVNLGLEKHLHYIFLLRVHRNLKPAKE